MSALVPYTILIIKPLSIGRGDGPSILEDLLNDCPVMLRKFRPWSICDSTWAALSKVSEATGETLDAQAEQTGQAGRMAWACLFTHKDRLNNPTPILQEYCGPEDRKLWNRKHLRYRYSVGRGSTHPSDTVVHISDKGKVSLAASLLFLNFDEESL